MADPTTPIHFTVEGYRHGAYRVIADFHVDDSQTGLALAVEVADQMAASGLTGQSPPQEAVTLQPQRGAEGNGLRTDAETQTQSSEDLADFFGPVHFPAEHVAEQPGLLPDTPPQQRGTLAIGKIRVHPRKRGLAKLEFLNDVAVEAETERSPADLAKLLKPLGDRPASYFTVDKTATYVVACLVDYVVKEGTKVVVAVRKPQ